MKVNIDQNPTVSRNQKSILLCELFWYQSPDDGYWNRNVWRRLYIIINSPIWIMLFCFLHIYIYIYIYIYSQNWTESNIPFWNDHFENQIDLSTICSNLFVQSSTGLSYEISWMQTISGWCFLSNLQLIRVNSVIKYVVLLRV